MKAKCPICKKEFTGRTDKKFCSVHCKSNYHARLRNATDNATHQIDLILHRNRSILLECVGKITSQIKIHRQILDNKKFNYNYITSYHTNAHGKMVHYVYDFSWIVFSDQEVLIKRVGQ